MPDSPETYGFGLSVCAPFTIIRIGRSNIKSKEGNDESTVAGRSNSGKHKARWLDKETTCEMGSNLAATQRPETRT